MPEGFLFLFLGCGFGSLVNPGNSLVWFGLAYICAWWIVIRRFRDMRRAKLVRLAEETPQPRTITEDERTELLAFERAKETAQTVEVMVAVGMGAAPLLSANNDLTAQCEALASRYPEWRDVVLRATYQRGLTDPDGPLSVLAWITSELNPEKARLQPGDLILRGKFLLAQREASPVSAFLRNGQILHSHCAWWLERHRTKLFARMQGEHAKSRWWFKKALGPDGSVADLLKQDLMWLERAQRS